MSLKKCPGPLRKTRDELHVSIFHRVLRVVYLRTYNINFLPMKSFKKIMGAIDRAHPADPIHAHCDVPCGVYTVHRAGIAAETVEKMVQKLGDLAVPSTGASLHDTLHWENDTTRMIMAKEEWAQICKEELLILWTDYFKKEHLEMFPDLHTTFWNAAKLCSTNKQEVSAEAAKELRETVDKINEMFKKAEGDRAMTKRQRLL